MRKTDRVVILVSMVVVVVLVQQALARRPLPAPPVATVTATTSRYVMGTRVVTFAGSDWVVKSGFDGPGPNQFSDSEESVWVDVQGRLHLQLRQVGPVWYCAEVYTPGSTRYGSHRFVIDPSDPPIDGLDRNIVAAVFLYQDLQHEIDIEFAKWGSIDPGYNAQYVVQPYTIAGNMVRFRQSYGQSPSVHTIDWQPSAIHFSSTPGSSSEGDEPPAPVHQWRYSGPWVPAEADALRVHINLWLVDGQAPADGREIEFVIADVQLP